MEVETDVESLLVNMELRTKVRHLKHLRHPWIYPEAPMRVMATHKIVVAIPPNGTF